VIHDGAFARFVILTAHSVDCALSEPLCVVMNRCEVRQLRSLGPFFRAESNSRKGRWFCCLYTSCRERYVLSVAKATAALSPGWPSAESQQHEPESRETATTFPSTTAAAVSRLWASFIFLLPWVSPTANCLCGSAAVVSIGDGTMVPNYGQSPPSVTAPGYPAGSLDLVASPRRL